MLGRKFFKFVLRLPNIISLPSGNVIESHYTDDCTMVSIASNFAGLSKAFKHVNYKILAHLLVSKMLSFIRDIILTTY
jgi:hypothetical protein